MKLKVLALVSGILVALAVAAFAVNRWMNTPSGLGRVGQTLMPDADPALARRIDIVSPDRTVTLNSADGTVWTVAQQDNFPVDTKKIKNLFVKLTTLKVAHQVTDNPDRLGELGLLTKDENGGKLQAEKTGKVLTITGKDGKPVYGLLLGNDRHGQGAMTFGGTYVRFPQEKAAYLISDSVLVDLRPEDWIDTNVLDVDADKTLHTIQVRQAGQRELELSRDKAGEAWKIAGMPADQVDPDAVRRLASQVAGLDIFKVAAGNAPPAETGRQKTGQVTFELFDKRRFTLDVGEAKGKDDFRFLSIQAALDPAVKDEALHQWVDAFNTRFGGRLLGVYDWDGSRMLQGWNDYKKKPAKKP
jgi:Domain of unknown function (DUF4340)